MRLAVSSDSRAWSAIETTRRANTCASLGGSYSGTAVKSVTRAFASRANSMPWATAFSATSEPSVGIRMCLYMRPLLKGRSSPARAETDRRRREVGDARKELLEVSLLQAGDRVAVLRERRVDRLPVLGGQRALGERHELLLFLAH